jgi:hypothetical protein
LPEFSGREFNKIYRGCKFNKIIPKGFRKYGFRYKYGLNIDTVEFNPSETCSAGGIYFTDEGRIDKFNNYGEVIVDVTVPDDARVYIEDDKFKADKIVLKNFRDYSYPFKKTRSSEYLTYGALLIGGYYCFALKFQSSNKKFLLFIQCLIRLITLYI